MCAQQGDRFDVASSGVRECLVGDLDASRSDDADSEVRLMRVDPADELGHDVLLLDQMDVPVVRERQESCGTSESSFGDRLLSSQKRSCRSLAECDTSDNRHKAKSLVESSPDEGPDRNPLDASSGGLTMTLGKTV